MNADRAAEIAALGHRGLDASDAARLEQVVTADPDPRVRAIALGAVVRAGAPGAAPAWAAAATDVAAEVRRRAAELAPALGATAPDAALLALLADREPLVAEAAAFALGERGATDATITALVDVVLTHRDALVREAAVAALGALGDERGLPAVLHACDDKPAVRRRAVLALAAFEGDEVEARIRAALEDRDWQVRQAAEDLLNEPFLR